MSFHRRFQSVRLFVFGICISATGAATAEQTRTTPAVIAGAQRPSAPTPKADLSPAATPTRQQREREDLRRQDIASQLAQLGLSLKWQEWGLEQLTDWRDRLQAAQSLRAQFGVEVDWRTQSLASLTDMRLRAAKASELSTVYAVQVDWRRYSWVALESLRRQVAKVRGGHAAASEAAMTDGLVRPRNVRNRYRTGFRSRDPDAILEPTFAFDTPTVWSRPFGRRAKKSDPDAILVPTFVTLPSPVAGPDDLIVPWTMRPTSFNP